MNNKLEIKKFCEIDLSDPFFDSLKEDYSKFEEWFRRKGEQNVYVIYDGESLDGFLYLKFEKEDVVDVEPNIESNNILKIGTFKINAHGTKLGERFLKRIFDIAIQNDVEFCYVTVFPKQEALIELFTEYGFVVHGVKKSVSGTELVYIKQMRESTGNIYHDYPRVNTSSNKFLLSVYPKYHTNLFPDSKLFAERFDSIKDESYTNSIIKVYVGSMKDLERLTCGDLIVIYRTSDKKGSAEYRSVATSICTVADVKHQREFDCFDDFYKYASKYSVFDKEDLNYWYHKGNCLAIKMLYNVALEKRLIRKSLIEKCGIRRDDYPGFMSLSDDVFKKIIELGEINESYIIY